MELSLCGQVLDFDELLAESKRKRTPAFAILSDEDVLGSAVREYFHFSKQSNLIIPNSSDAAAAEAKDALDYLLSVAKTVIQNRFYAQFQICFSHIARGDLEIIFSKIALYDARVEIDSYWNKSRLVETLSFEGLESLTHKIETEYIQPSRPAVAGRSFVFNPSIEKGSLKIGGFGHDRQYAETVKSIVCVPDSLFLNIVKQKN